MSHPRIAKNIKSFCVQLPLENLDRRKSGTFRMDRILVLIVIVLHVGRFNIDSSPVKIKGGQRSSDDWTDAVVQLVGRDGAGTNSITRLSSVPFQQLEQTFK